MADLDYGRKMDLEELSRAMQKANSVSEREHYEKIMWRIMGESQPIRSLRNELIKAMRAGDIRKIKRIEKHIHYIRSEETYGKSWGSNKGNRNVN